MAPAGGICDRLGAWSSFCPSHNFMINEEILKFDKNVPVPHGKTISCLQDPAACLEGQGHT